MRFKPDVQTGMLLPETARQRHGVPDNPADPAKWAEMDDDGGPLYKVLASIVTIKGPNGTPVAPHEYPREGEFMHAKDFGPGAEIQRLIDLKMIRESDEREMRLATVQKVETTRADDHERPLKGREYKPPGKNSPKALAGVPA